MIIFSPRGSWEVTWRDFLSSNFSKRCSTSVISTSWKGGTLSVADDSTTTIYQLFPRNGHVRALAVEEGLDWVCKTLDFSISGVFGIADCWSNLIFSLNLRVSGFCTLSLVSDSPKHGILPFSGRHCFIPMSNIFIPFNRFTISLLFHICRSTLSTIRFSKAWNIAFP